jgi:hypothetical protein
MPGDATNTVRTSQSLPLTNTATLSVSPSVSVTATLSVPDRFLVAAAAAASGSEGLSAAGIGLIVGLLVALIVAAFIACCVVRPALLAWRRRRRKGDNNDDTELGAHLKERNSQYRWYEDAEAVAADLEQRGDAVQAQDHEGLLRMPTMLEGMASRTFTELVNPVPMVSLASATASEQDEEFSDLFGPSTAQSKPPKVNPLMRR